MRSCLPLRPTLNHDSPLVYPGHPGSPFRAESPRGPRPRATGAEPGDARAAAAARPGRAGSARCRAASRRAPVAGAAQPLHRRSGRGSPASGRSRCRQRSSEREAVRIGVMRGTIHLLTADDCLVLRPATQPVFEGQLWRHRDFSPQLRGVDLDPVIEAGRLALEEPRTGTELRAFLAARFPKLDAAALAYACQMRLALVQVPPRGLWRTERPGSVDDGRGVARADRSTAAPSLEEIVLRYLAAFGPASVADATTWCRLTGLREVVERLRPQLVTVRDERGRELFDLPGRTAARSRHARAGPLPARVRQRAAVARRPQPVRLGARSRTARAGVVGRLGRGAPRRPRARASGARRPTGIVVRHVPLSKEAVAAVAAEGRRLARFLGLDRRRAAGARQLLRPAPRRVSASAPRSEANASASWISMPLASANVSPAAKQSPAP